MNFASKATRTIAPLLILFFAIGCSTTPGSKDSKKSAQEDPTTLTSAEVFRDPDRMICRRERPTGSRISEKICMTARQWFDMSEQSRDALDKAQRAPDAGGLSQ